MSELVSSILGILWATPCPRIDQRTYLFWLGATGVLAWAAVQLPGGWPTALAAIAAALTFLIGNVRRLHDRGKSGWWLAAWIPLSAALPFMWIVGLVLQLREGGQCGCFEELAQEARERNQRTARGAHREAHRRGATSRGPRMPGNWMG